MPTDSLNEPSENAPHFEETQWSPVWVLVLLAPAAVLAVVMAFQGVWHNWNPYLLFPLGTLLLTFNLLCVKTRVDARFLVVTFGALFPLYRRRVSLEDIASAQAVTYNPLGEYGGWGIRGTKGDQVLSARGNAGVRLVLADGNKLLVGSGQPEALEAVLLPPS